MKAEVRMHQGTPTLYLDGEPSFYSCLWMSSDPTEDGFPAEECIRAFGKQGVHLYAIGPRVFGESREEMSDFSHVEVGMRRVMIADPDAHFHLRLYFETPVWWNEENPDECEISSEDVRLNQSYASTVWQDEVNAYLRALIGFLESVGLADRVIAYQPMAGICGEWIKNVTSMQERCGDYSAPMRRRFQAWARERYNDDTMALQAAWNNPAVTFDTLSVPSAEMQHTTTAGLFRDPVREQQVIDYYRCLADVCAAAVIDFCHTVKVETGGQALAGAFFGYIMDLAWNDCFFGSETDRTDISTIQRSGHLGLRTVLESADVDFLVSPYGYAFRGLGGDGLPMPPSESLRIHGKLYIYEEDSRLHNLMDPEGRNYRPEHGPSIHNRCFAQSLTHGLGIWWFADWPAGTYQDLGKSEPEFQPLLERYQQLGSWALGLDRTPAAEVAVLIDDESFFYETIRNTINLPLIFQQRVWGLPRFGAPHDVYLLQDLIDGKLPPYKLYIFLNPVRLDRRRREALAGQLRRDGRVAVWLYAAGYIEDTPSVDHMTDLTGFHFGTGRNAWGPMMHISNFQHEITRDIPQDLMWGTNNSLLPLFHLEDPEATELGQVVYSLGRCKPGMAVKELETWKSIYIAAPNVPAPVLRGIARYAGVHLFSEAGDVLYATRDMLSVHTLSGGSRVFRLPERVEVVQDLYEDRIVAENTDVFEVTLSPGSTVLYYTGATKQMLRR
ncbi:MAG: hypothetical protein HN712_13505 [Gemmatimonadetes bacterium]|jgi:hypothetical protein|nr:hypothetical protein [Gemmatimonadota bacterium]MBT6149906.1 hypothetical protein [Gemmatimonadota bacterium]MBT7861332.1 hypothetical protein [Gemmatimonadota bacterium]